MSKLFSDGRGAARPGRVGAGQIVLGGTQDQPVGSNLSYPAEARRTMPLRQRGRHPSGYHAISALLSTCAVIAASCTSYSALADDAVPVETSPGPKIPSQTLTTAAGTTPFSLKVQYTGEAWDNALGGLHDGTTYIQNVDAQLYINAADAFGWTGGSFLFEGFYNNARSLDTQYVGSAQDVSAIDTSGVKVFRLYQAFYKQSLGDTNLLFGIYDLETEFGSTKPMEIFFNGAYAWTFTLDQSGATGPSTYPNTAPAFRVRQKLNDQWSVQAAVLDGVSDSRDHPAENTVIFNRDAGALAIGEVDYTPIRGTKIMAGYWGYTGKFDALDDTNANGTQRQVHGSSGGYIGGATRLYSPAPGRGLDAFANLGLADPKTNQIDRSLNFGLTYTGLLDDRPGDKLGFAVGLAGDSNAYRAMQLRAGNGVGNTETNFELTYRAKITDWLTVQPDIQYLVHPNTDPTLKNDLVFGVHFELSHVFDF
jgi:porin